MLHQRRDIKEPSQLVLSPSQSTLFPLDSIFVCDSAYQMAPVQSRVTRSNGAPKPSTATAASTSTLRNTGLWRTTQKLTAKQQQLEDKKAEESNKVQQKKHPAAGSRKGNQQATRETDDGMFTVVRHTEATPPVARGRSTNRQGGIRTNPPTRNPPTS